MSTVPAPVVGSTAKSFPFGPSRYISQLYIKRFEYAQSICEKRTSEHLQDRSWSGFNIDGIIIITSSTDTFQVCVKYIGIGSDYVWYCPVLQYIFVLCTSVIPVRRGYNYDSTSMWRPFDGGSTAYQRSLRSPASQSRWPTYLFI